MDGLLLIGGIAAIVYLIVSFWIKYQEAKDALETYGEVFYSDENGSLVSTGLFSSEFCFIKSRYKGGEGIFVFRRKYVEEEKKKGNLYLKLHPLKTHRLLSRNLYYDEYGCSDSENAVDLTLEKQIKKLWLALNSEDKIVFLWGVPEDAKEGDVVKGEKVPFPTLVPVSQEI